MDIKKELGKKIRRLREQKGESRDLFCGNEQDLTVRQLSRIESGESLPTLPKLTYISQKLAVPIYHLIDEKHMELPKAYLKLKNDVLKISLYEDEKRITQQEKLFEEIYEQYYDNLPEEEQLSIDVYQATIDVHLSQNTDFGVGILNDYFFQVNQKTTYTENDLLIILLYMTSRAHEDLCKEEEINVLIEKTIEQVDLSTDLKAFILNRILILAMPICILNGNYQQLKRLIETSKTVMQNNQDFQKKAIVEMVEGKYWLFSESNREKAEDKYQDAIMLSRLLEDFYLAKKIEEEWESDLNAFMKL